MSDSNEPRYGEIAWVDLTVGDAASMRDFYAGVAGWRYEEVSMNGYSDFNMLARPGGTPVAGICHARGGNADLPATWLVYINVADLDESLAQCTTSGGAVLKAPTGMGSAGRYAVIRDPAGAAVALFEPSSG